MSPFATLASLALWAANALAVEDLLQQIDGTYETPSQCTTVTSEGHEPCSPKLRDRLRITRVDERTASFELYSVQINGHQCEIDGVAELQDDSLIYLDPDTKDPGQGLRIKITSSALVLSYLKPLTGPGQPPFCGMRARVDRLSFPRRARTEQPLTTGRYGYEFQHRFGEAEHWRIPSIKLIVDIDGDHIVLVNADSDDVFPFGIMDEGVLMWHEKTQQWIVGHDEADRDAPDVGPCSDGPEVIDLEQRIYWTC